MWGSPSSETTTEDVSAFPSPASAKSVKSAFDKEYYFEPKIFLDNEEREIASLAWSSTLSEGKDIATDTQSHYSEMMGFGSIIDHENSDETIEENSFEARYGSIWEKNRTRTSTATDENVIDEHFGESCDGVTDDSRMSNSFSLSEKSYGSNGASLSQEGDLFAYGDKDISLLDDFPPKDYSDIQPPAAKSPRDTNENGGTLNSNVEEFKRRLAVITAKKENKSSTSIKTSNIPAVRTNRDYQEYMDHSHNNVPHIPMEVKTIDNTGSPHVRWSTASIAPEPDFFFPVKGQSVRFECLEPANDTLSTSTIRRSASRDTGNETPFSIRSSMSRDSEHDLLSMDSSDSFNNQDDYNSMMMMMQSQQEYLPSYRDHRGERDNRDRDRDLDWKESFTSRSSSSSSLSLSQQPSPSSSFSLSQQQQQQMHGQMISSSHMNIQQMQQQQQPQALIQYTPTKSTYERERIVTFKTPSNPSSSSSLSQSQHMSQDMIRSSKLSAGAVPWIAHGAGSSSSSSSSSHNTMNLQMNPPAAQYVMVPGIGLVLVPGLPVSNMHTMYNMPVPAHLSMKTAGHPEKNIQRESADGYIYQVHFKHAQRSYLLGPSAPRYIRIGDFVKVEADRGEDLGVVCDKIQAAEFREEKPTAGFRGRGIACDLADCKRITRLATDEERELLPGKAMEEMQVLQVCREKVHLQFLLPMQVIDAEYQFDRHKLTFFFEADRRVDFRELVRDLFALYKTRIWMQQIDASFQPNEWASRALTTGHHMSSVSEPNTCVGSGPGSGSGRDPMSGRSRAMSGGDLNDGDVLNRLSRIWSNDQSQSFPM
eukprot:gene2272-4421_t